MGKSKKHADIIKKYEVNCGSGCRGCKVSYNSEATTNLEFVSLVEANGWSFTNYWECSTCIGPKCFISGVPKDYCDCYQCRIV